ncbi:DNA methyltransferase [Caulobacter sp. RHG1]|uniref:DNA methyltransferase n=1 Tax=Caulobacter sp. (strain RHG1) TaxID=2545762 RepID=UPI001555BD19|nr:DNA methyltransferase [Caulobacter sp. RHG1]
MPFDAAQKVNETATPVGAEGLGASLRALRRHRRLTQLQLATSAAMDIATVRQLEAGGGTVAPLLRATGILNGRFVGQPPEMALGAWIAAARKAAGLTQSALAALVGVSKPTVVQIEHGQGSIRSLTGAMTSLGLAPELTPRSALGLGMQLYEGDCLDILPLLPDRSVNTIITDLPYGSTELDWDQPIPLEPLWDQFRRLLTPNGTVIMTASQPFTSHLITSNLAWFKYSLVWEKTRPTGFLHAKHMPLKKHEDVCVFSPGVVVGRHRSERQMTYHPQNLEPLPTPKHRANGYTHGTFIGRKLGASTVQTHTGYPTSILRFASEAAPIHPTQKPIDLMRYLVRTYSHPGDTVMDVCMGSGTTGVAAVLEGRQFIGIELDAEYFQAASMRLAQCLKP